MILWQLLTLRLACFHGNMVLAHTDVSTPEKTLALIFEQLTLLYEQQNFGMYPGLTVQNIHQIHTKLTFLKAVNRSLVTSQLWLGMQKEKESIENGKKYEIKVTVEWKKQNTTVSLNFSYLKGSSVLIFFFILHLVHVCAVNFCFCTFKYFNPKDDLSSVNYLYFQLISVIQFYIQLVSTNFMQLNIGMIAVSSFPSSTGPLWDLPTKLLEITNLI